MKALIGVIPEEVLRTRVLAIAAGTYKPQEGEPKVWFTSLNAVAQVLSNENIRLLRLIEDMEPESVTQLAKLSGRQVSNLSTTLRTLSAHGFVSLDIEGRKVKPKALFTDFEIHVEHDFSTRFEAA